MRYLVIALLALHVRPAGACATAPPEGATVRIADEEAVIVWDPATKTQHFIRRASFASTARRFGFLVPTPTIPKLSEVTDSVFQQLAAQIAPPIRYERSTSLRPGSWCAEAVMMTAGSDKSIASAPAPVRVLATAHVAGFDATTLEADDANALAQWLSSHGFAATPALTAWLDRYVKDHWKITAFVVATDQDGMQQYEVATKSVHMTFQTDRPFYPYREPKLDVKVESTTTIVPPKDRELRVFFASTARYAATLAGQPWTARVTHAAPLPQTASIDLAAMAVLRYLTVFVDDSSPRRGLDELYFAPSADTTEVHQPEQVIVYPDETVIPLDFIALIGLIVFIVVRRRRKT